MNNKREVDLSCYIVISCEMPSPEGNMKVQMSYEGDPILVRYLLETGLQSLEDSDAGLD